MKQIIEATSYYAFAESGQFYLFNTDKVSVFQAPEPVYRMAGLWESHKPEDIYKELCRHYPHQHVKEYLAKALKLNLFAKAPAPSIPQKEYPVKELYLQVCHDCNLKCRYCYAGGGQFGGSALKMDEQTAFRAIDFFLEQLPSGTTGFINYDGGEPLLNWPVIERTSQYAAANARAAGKRAAFKLGTNGTLLNAENTEHMNRYGFSVGISIDGDRQTHDACRRYNEDKGSYDKIEDNIGAYKKKLPGCTVQARATITPANLEVTAIVQHLFHLGFDNVYFEPVSGVPDSWALTESDLDVIEARCARLAEDYSQSLLSGEKISITNFDMFLKRLHQKKKFLYKCEVGRTGIAVTPGGEVFPCYKFANTQGFKMADITETGSGSGALTSEHRTRFRNNHVDARQDCKDCWARYLCGGGCAYLGYLDHGDIARKNKRECRFTRHMIKLSMLIYVTVNQKEPDFWNRYFKE